MHSPTDSKIVTLASRRREPARAVATPTTVRIGEREFDFTSYAEVSDAYVRAVNASGAVSGTSAWLADRGKPVAPDCEILDADGNCIAWVSYNGRVWAGALHNQEYKLIHDSREVA